MPGSVAGGVGAVDCEAYDATATFGADGAAAAAAAVGGEGDIMEGAVAAGCGLFVMFFA